MPSATFSTFLARPLGRSASVLSLLAALAAVLVAGPRAALAQDAAPAKPRLGIRSIEATPSVLRQADSSGQANVLRQILEGADSLLTTSITRTRRFDVVARKDLPDLIREQDLGGSGLVDPNDPQAAEAGRLAGAAYVATVTVDNYQDVTTRAELEGQFGRTPSERRVIQLQATLKIFEATTGVLKDAQTITLEESAFNEILPGADQAGRATNKLVGVITKAFADESANRILDSIVPAKVMAYTMGVVTFNRGEGTGVEPGQAWRIFFPGAPLIDPDTGEDLGSEEVHIGWAIVDSVEPRFAKARVVQDNGIDRGAIMRPVRGGLPADVDPNARVTGSAPSGGAAPAPRGAAAAPRGAAAAPTAAPPPGAGTISLALFTADVAPDVPDQKVEVLESYLQSVLTASDIRVISRRDVLNAVSNLAADGDQRGTGDPSVTEVERLLSDQSSAKALAANLGADGFLVATITALERDERTIDDPQLGVSATTIFSTLDVTWRVLDGATGGSLAGGIETARGQVRRTRNLDRQPTPIDDLLRDAARGVAASAQTALRTPGRPGPVAANDARVAVTFAITMQDLNVPEIRKIDGEWTVTANRYQLAPMACNLLVDGFLVGSVPGRVELAPGPQRLRIERPGLEPVDRFVNAREGMTFTIPMQFSPEGRAKWMEQTRFLDSLKEGAILRENEQKLVEGLQQFLKQSNLRIDTSNVRNLGGDSIIWDIPTP